MKYLFILFTSIVFGQQIPLDSISYQYFYGKELKAITQLKDKAGQDNYSAINQLQIAELYRSINCEDSAYVTYYNVFYKEKKKKTLSKDLFNELLFNLHIVESSKHKYKRDRRFFLDSLKKSIASETTDKWQAKIANEIAKDNLADSSKYTTALSQFLKLQQTNFYEVNKEFRAITLLNIGVTNTYLKNYDIAKKYLDSCLLVSEENKDYLRAVYAYLNLSFNELQRSDFKASLSFLDKIDSVPNEKFKIKINRIYFQQKGDSYYGLNDKANTAISDAYRDKLDSLISDFSKNSHFYETDIRYQVKEKDKKISQLSAFINKTKQHKIVFAILLFFVFLLALYSFIRWKKVDRKKKLLTQEKAVILKEQIKTINELEKVKKLVIEDFIILKNKSKVYLSELIYIKSEDHYLNLFTENKKEFVRGKISEIEKQLPPNFVKCHRSYIVNKNYIKQFLNNAVIMKNGETIPVKRNFKF